MRVTKRRDLPAREPMPFSLKVVELGTGRRGKPLTSCIVEHEDEEMAAEPRGKAMGRKPLFEENKLLELLPATSVMWRRAAMERSGISRATFYIYKAELEASGKVVLDMASKRYFATPMKREEGRRSHQSECAGLLSMASNGNDIRNRLGFPDDPRV